MRRINQDTTNHRRDKINHFTTHFPLFRFVSDVPDLTMFRTDKMGREVDSPFGFLKFVSAEHIGMEVPKQILGLPRNSLVSKWSIMKDIVEKVSMYQPSNDDYLQKTIKIN